MLAGTRQAIFVGGEPGSGKSRLVAEAVRAMHGEGAAVLMGASIAEFGIPYQPFVEAFDELFAGTRENSLGPMLPESAPELLRLTAGVRRHRPEITSPPPAEQEYRHELLDAVVDLFRALATARPVVLVVEDLHWSRPPTQLMLSHLVEQTVDERLMVLATHRTTAPDRSDDVTFAIAGLYRLPGVRRLDLGGLDTEDIVDFLVTEAAIDAPEARPSAALLRDQTGGNPFYLRELWRDLADHGGLAALRSGAVRPPSTVRHTLERRYRAMPSSQRDVIDLAAVLGVSFDVFTLLEASQDDPDTTLAALDESAAFGLVQRTGGGDGYEFRHALARQAVLDRMSPARLVNLHAAVGHALEQRRGRDSQLAPRLAYHFAKAAALGHGPKAAHYAREAARLAERTFAHEEAAGWLEEAARLGDEGEAERHELLFAAADAFVKAGDFDNARRVYEGLVGSDDPDARLRAAAGYEDASWRPGHVGDRALEFLDRALAGTEADPANPHYVRALARQGRAYGFTGDLVRSREVVTGAVEMARAIGDAELLADALETGFAHGGIPGNAATDYQRAIELSEIAEQTGRFDHLVQAALARRMIAYIGGQPSEWHRAHDDLRRASRKLGQPFWNWLLRCGDFTRAFIAGDFGAAFVLAEELLRRGQSFGNDDTEGPYGLQMFVLQRETGGLDDVRPLVQPEEARGAWAPGLLALFTELEMIEPAGHLLDRMIAGMRPEHETTAEWPAVLTFLVDAACLVRSERAGRALRPHVARYAGLNLMAGMSVVVFGSAHRYLARLDHLLGEPGASEHFEQALAMDKKMGSIVHEAETLAGYAEFLDDGDPARAAHCRARARELAEPRGHIRVLRRLEAAKPAAGLPHGLTPREVDVLRLLAAGLSNREIADRLFISPNTAANHVRSILTKTAVSNRTQAAILAAEQGLLD